ncbi:hypothetical protein E2C01_067981 [Portunus trituberculatus]|uniref:Uncharacterized protein n=1 Tax=Portunus trituberculatus TaxID=210409 RepID=A0A5B7HV41_PORTR|nr:hypothetical protein [Portunus trituberculatus]
MKRCYSHNEVGEAQSPPGRNVTESIECHVNKYNRIELNELKRTGERRKLTLSQEKRHENHHK